MFRGNQILKSIPSTFQNVLKKIERTDLLSIVDKFYYDKHSAPKVITKGTINSELESLSEVFKAFITSLYLFNPNYFEDSSLTTLSMVLENVFHQAYMAYETIQEAIKKFSLEQARGMSNLLGFLSLGM